MALSLENELLKSGEELSSVHAEYGKRYGSDADITAFSLEELREISGRIVAAEKKYAKALQAVQNCRNDLSNGSS